jgi:hypothetical protein
MLGKLIWETSGDEITFKVTFPDLFDYYLDQLTQKNANKFFCNKKKFSNDLVSALQNSIQSIEKFKNKLPFVIDDWSGDLLDQDYLNKLHRDWVKTGIVHPGIVSLLRAMNNADVHYRNINSGIHAVENSFDYEFVNYSQDPFQVENIFGKQITGFDIDNLMLGFDNLGRSPFEKFKNWDDNIADTDTSTYQMLSGIIDFSLCRPMVRQPPPNYLEWCQKHSVHATGISISLGNIIDLDKQLTDIRKILIRNTNEQNNQFFFEICSK